MPSVRDGMSLARPPPGRWFPPPPPPWTVPAPPLPCDHSSMRQLTRGATDGTCGCTACAATVPLLGRVFGSRDRAFGPRRASGGLPRHVLAQRPQPQDTVWPHGPCACRAATDVVSRRRRSGVRRRASAPCACKDAGWAGRPRGCGQHDPRPPWTCTPDTGACVRSRRPFERTGGAAHRACLSWHAPPPPCEIVHHWACTSLQPLRHRSTNGTTVIRQALTEFVWDGAVVGHGMVELVDQPATAARL